jgi:hypothetical protein
MGERKQKDSENRGLQGEQQQQVWVQKREIWPKGSLRYTHARAHSQSGGNGVSYHDDEGESTIYSLAAKSRRSVMRMASSRTPRILAMPAGISVCFARTYTCMLNSRFSSLEFLNCCCAEKEAVIDAEPKMKPPLAEVVNDCCIAMSLELLVTLVILALKSIVHSSIWECCNGQWAMAPGRATHKQRHLRLTWRNGIGTMVRKGTAIEFS